MKPLLLGLFLFAALRVPFVFGRGPCRKTSKSARTRPGKGHATRILAEHPFMVKEIADWLAKQLEAEPG
jgi:hypothetical protein